MWRRGVWLLKQRVSAASTPAVLRKTISLTATTLTPASVSHFNFANFNNYRAAAAIAVNEALFNKTNSVSFSSSTPPREGDGDGDKSVSQSSNLGTGTGTENITLCEAKKLMRLVNVEALKIKLGMDGKEVIGYTELLEACSSMGVSRTIDEAIAFARVLDEAGVVLLFRDKVYLHPDKVVDLIRRAVPLALHPENDPMRDELKMLQEKKEEIDVLAHKQVRRILWFGLGISIVHIGLFFRLTFWEFSWDVMEPIAFFSTTTGLILGYAYFLITSRDPTYQDLLKRLFLSRQRKLIKKLHFDVNRFKELQSKCKTPLVARDSIKNRIGLELDLEDALHRD